MNRKEQLQTMLTPNNWEELQFYVTAAAHNEHGPDREITDQFYEDAINEIVSENMTAMGIMREDKQKIRQLELECAALRKALSDAIGGMEGLADQQAMPDDWYLPILQAARAALGEGNPHS